VRVGTRAVPLWAVATSQGFRDHSPFNSKFASYEDRRADYVTSEPALDYAAATILLLATLDAGC